MFTTRHGFLFGESAVEFPSCYPLAESVVRLRTAVASSEFLLLRQTAVGTVQDDEVRLKWGGPSTLKAYRLRFEGAFRHGSEGVILAGKFIVDGAGEMRRTIILAIWQPLLGFLMLGTLLQIWFILLPLILIVIVLCLLSERRHRRESAHEEVAWISAVIERALTVQ